MWQTFGDQVYGDVRSVEAPAVSYQGKYKDYFPSSILELPYKMILFVTCGETEAKTIYSNAESGVLITT